jgi:hypothetical protein
MLGDLTILQDKDKIDTKMDHPSLVLLDPYRWGWPVIGPIHNLSHRHVVEERECALAPLPLTEQMSSDDVIGDTANSMDSEYFSRSVSFPPPISLCHMESATSNGTPRHLTRNNGSSQNEGTKRSQYASPTTPSDESMIQHVVDPHLVNIECDVEVGGQCFPLNMRWNLSDAKTYSVDRDIFTYARNVAIELGLAFHEEARLVASIRAQVKHHVDKLVEVRSQEFDFKYGNSKTTITKLEGTLAKESAENSVLKTTVDPVSSSSLRASEESKRKKSSHNESHDNNKKKAPTTSTSTSTNIKGKATANASRSKAKEDVAMPPPPPPEEVWVEVLPEDHNTDICGLCLKGGDLLCCDKCPRAFHLNCLQIKEEDLPEGDWICSGNILYI